MRIYHRLKLAALVFICSSALYLQSCASVETTHFVARCPPQSPDARSQEIAEICRNAGMDSVTITTGHKIHHVLATKRHWQSLLFPNLQYSNYVWSIFIRLDTIIAFPHRTITDDAGTRATVHYNDTTSQDHDWYWSVRNKLAALCNEQTHFVLQTNLYDEYYQDELDTTRREPFIIATMLEVAPIDTSRQGLEITETKENRIPFFENTEFGAIWELDHALLTGLGVSDSAKIFDRIRLFKQQNGLAVGMGNYLVEARELGLEPTLKRFVLSEQHVQALSRSLEGKIYHPNNPVLLRSEQYMTRGERWYLGEILVDIYSANALLAQLLPESFLLGRYTGLFRGLNSYRIAVPILNMLVGCGLTIYANSEPWYTRPVSLMLADGATWGVPQGMALWGLFSDEISPNLFAMHSFGVATSLVRTYLTLRLPELLGWNYAQTLAIQGSGASGTALGMILPLQWHRHSCLCEYLCCFQRKA